jgi:Family of unknown function (DUF6941)
MTDPTSSPEPSSDTLTTPDSPAAITRSTVLAFFAADHVAIAPDGKMYVNGAFFSLLRFPVFPATIPTLGIAAAIEMPFQDAMQDHKLRIVLRGPEHQELPVGVEATFRTAPNIEAQYGEPQIVPFGVTIPSVEIPSPGAYHLVLWLDNVEKAAYRMRAIQVPMNISVGIPPNSGGPVGS